MNKICPRCGVVYKYNPNGCPNNCAKKLRTESNRIYDNLQRKNKEFYSSKEWKKLRDLCKNRFLGICIWSYYKHNKFIKGRISHHIIPVDIDKELALNLSNLLYVSDEAHAEIHSLYNETSREKFIENNEEILKEIQTYIIQWQKQGGI